VNVTESRGPKSDERDAFGLAEKLRQGKLERRVFKDLGPRAAWRLPPPRRPSPVPATASA